MTEYNNQNNYQQPATPPVAPPDFSGWYVIDPKYNNEKRKIRKDANWVCTGLLFMLFFQVLFSFGVQAIQSGMGIFEKTVFSEAIEYSFFSVLIVGLPFFIIAKASSHKISDILVFENSEKFVGFTLVLSGFLAIAVGNLLTDGIVAFFPKIYENYNNVIDTTPKSDTLIQLFIEVLAYSAIPALIEEFAFRGVALGILRKYGDWFAIISSAVLFSLMHANFYQIPFVMIVGIVFGLIVCKTNNIWYSVLLHFLNNASSSIISFIDRKVSLNATVFNFLYYFVVILIGVVGYILYRTKKKELITEGLASYSGCLSSKTPYGIFFSCPCFIISAFFLLLSAIVYAL